MITKSEFQQLLEQLAEYVEESQKNPTQQFYTPDDLVNASLAFLHVLTDLMFWHTRHFGIEKQGLIAEECVKNLKQTVFLATGVDVAEISQTREWPETVE